MRLATKLALTVTVSTCAVVGAHTVWSVDRVILRATQHTNDEITARGRILAVTVTDVWRVDGEQKARWLVAQADADLQSQRFAWLDFAGAMASPPEFAGTAADWRRLGRGESLPTRRDTANNRLVKYVPIAQGGATRAVLAVSEPLDFERHEVSSLIERRILMALLVALACGLTIILTAQRFVGRPLRAFTDHARRIAAGDLSGRLPAGRSDEIGTLARQLNEMADQLARAGERIEIESQRRWVALAAARHAGRLKVVGQLASALVHEMGTPLNVVAGRAKMLQRGQVAAADVPKVARIIGAQVDKMTQRIRNLLGFVRRRPRPHDRVDLCAVVDESITLLEPLLAKRGVEVERRVHVGGDADVHGDAGQLEQVVANLLTNAAQAMTSPGSVVVALSRDRATHPETAQALDAWRLSVSDAGAGIPPELREHIFEPFFTTKQDEGTGLGLSVSAGIVREHGGWFEVESEPGAGATFHVILPVSGVRQT